ncbi:hypothetical protein Bbelb_127280 [Branchiostoma belcheri]|nr:hypothetical protein Bbelb_127280 [Branchiostoma belcheri]
MWRLPCCPTIWQTLGWLESAAEHFPTIILQICRKNYTSLKLVIHGDQDKANFSQPTCLTYVHGESNMEPSAKQICLLKRGQLEQAPDRRLGQICVTFVPPIDSALSSQTCDLVQTSTWQMAHNPANRRSRPLNPS